MTRSPSPWPRPASCAVLLTVNFDAELFWLRHDASCERRLKTVSIGEYGARRGVERLLTAFDDAGLSTSWFVPATIAERYPGAVRDVVACGHEVASRGVGRERLGELGVETQRDVLSRAREALCRVAGTEPVGFRPPPGEINRDLIEALQRERMVWTSLSRGDDRPYLLGQAAYPRLVEIPAPWELDDFPQFMFNYDPPYPAGQSRVAAYARVLADWRLEFDAHRELGLCYAMTLEPQCIGTPGRIALLEEHLTYLKSHEDVWFATGSEIAAWWQSTSVPTRTAIAKEHPDDSKN